MARTCKLCNQAYEDDVRICPFCGGPTEVDGRPMALLAADGYEVYRALRPRSERAPTEAVNRPARTPSVATSCPPVSVSISDDAVESLKSAYLNSSAPVGPAPNPTPAPGPAPSQYPSGSRPSEPAVPSTIDSDLDKLDELIEGLGIGSSSRQPSTASTTGSTHPAPPTGTSILEELHSEQERAERQLQNERRRRRVADTVGNVLRPGAVTGRIGHYLLVIVGVLLFVAFVLPPLFSAALAVISSLLPTVLAIAFLCWIFYRIFRG